MKTMLIKAKKGEDGYYRLGGYNSDGEYEEEEGKYPSAQAAYKDAALMWPSNSTWQGCKVEGGYRIVID